MVRKMEQPDGALIFDDTIEEKPHTDENEIVSWHFDHSKNRTLKGINILNCVYHAQGMTLPVAYEIHPQAHCVQGLRTPAGSSAGARSPRTN